MNLLKTSLLSNAIFSTTSGLVALIFNNELTNLFGFQDNPVFMIIGVGLLIFAATVFLESKKQRSSFVKGIIFQDLLWVLGSVILLVFDPFTISEQGNVIIAIVAAVVMMFSVGQYLGLKANK